MLRAARRELLDGPIDSVAELQHNFDDIERSNRFLGGLDAVRTALRGLPVHTLLDAGCGSGDVPRALVDDARAGGKQLEVTCVDSSDAVLAIARERSAGYAELSFVRGDAAALPFADKTFDAGICNLTLHHCEPDSAVRVLRELRRVARAPVVTDLRRSRIAWLAAMALTTIATANRLTRNDAPLSVLRAYTPAEALELARRAGWREPSVARTPFYRMVLTDG